MVLSSSASLFSELICGVRSDLLWCFHSVTSSSDLQRLQLVLLLRQLQLESSCLLLQLLPPSGRLRLHLTATPG